MPENLEEKKAKNKKKSSPSEDSEKQSYYYDDAFGYEIYEPENDEDDCKSSLPKASDSVE